MLIQNIALVPDAGGVTPAELLRVSAALQKQVSSHFGPCWGIQASVDPFLELEQVPAGYAPIVLSAPESMARSLEISLDPNGQPFARVSLHASWSMAASRACLELLINPFGQRTISATSPRSDQGPAEILVEACGAFGETPAAYAVNDVAVSDFCTPAFFRPAARASESYSFRGALGAPLSPLRGGHVAWFDPISDSWWLRSFHDEHPNDRSLGTLHARGRPLRELVLRQEPHGTGSALSLEPLDARIRWQWLREQASAASVARAQRLRQTLGLPQGTPRYEDDGDDEETVAMAISMPRHEPVRSHQRSGPPPLPETFEDHGLHTLDSSPYPSAELERLKSIVTRHERYTGGVIIAARDIPAGSLERRDTLPLAQLLPQPAASESPTPAPAAPTPAAPAIAEASAATVEAPVEAPASSREQNIEAPPARSATVERRASTQRPVTAQRPAAAEHSVTGTVSHSSIPPIAMLAEPVRKETSRAGLMIAAAGAAALLTVAIMSSGTRSAAHGAPANSPKPAAAVAAKPDTGSQQVAPPAIAAPLPMQPVVAKPQEHPVAVASARPERPRPTQPVDSIEAERERQEARERRRQQRERELSEKQNQPAAEPAGHERTAAIENLLDTRR